MERYRDYEEVMKNRYYHLYGQADCSSWLMQEKKKILLQFIIAILLFSVLIYRDVSDSRAEYSNVVVNEKGEIISAVRPDQGNESYSFAAIARIQSGEDITEKEYYITIEPAGEGVNGENEILVESTQENKADSELRKLISGINDDTSEKEVVLPDALEDGSQLVWMKTNNTDTVVYFIGLMFVLWLVYHNRFSGISKAEKEAKESVIKELPEFINKLVLLINAGVILNTAFLKIVDDCDERKCNSSYFYRRIADIGNMVRETNASFHQELYTFAKHSGVKELMRITNIMMDNISKGDDLSDKLRRENELLWFARKQQAEEKGKLAETKLTMPLMLLLTVLIMVTIAPALMEI